MTQPLCKETHITNESVGPLVSIVICCHNRANLLPQTMESVFAQEYEPVEIVVIDDGSTDNTPELMQTYGKKIRYFRQENQGCAAARNKGCQLAQGVYIAFQDDDDLMPPCRITDLLAALQRYPSAVLAVGDWAVIDPNGKVTGERSDFSIRLEGQKLMDDPVLLNDGYRAVMWPEVTPLPHTTLFRRSDAERVGWFDTGFFHACSDTDFFGRLARLGAVVYVPKIVTLYRKGHASIWTNEALAVYSRLMLLKKHIRTLSGDQKVMRKRLRARLLNTLKRLAKLETYEKELKGVPSDYSKQGLAVLNARDRIAYRSYVSLRIPLSRMLRILDRT